MSTPVSPGEPLLPRMTAQWYNSTLQENDPKAERRKNIILPREGELLCIAEDAIDRFDPVGVTSLGNEDALTYPRTPYVSKTDVDQHNWVIPQGGASADGVVMCVVFGLTRAWVTTRDASDNCVVYDPDSATLVTAKEGKAQILVKGGASFPSLINIGVQSNCVRVVGLLETAMTATQSDFSIGTLRGIDFSADELPTTISALNIHEFEADMGAVARAEWVHDTNRWEIYQVTCPA